MAGSQLKKLKAELKANGLIGQTNTKKKNKRGKNPVDARRDDKKEILGNIREKFNVFDSRTNRVKRDVTVIKEGKFVTAGKESANPTKSNSFLNKNLKLAYDSMRKTKGRNSRLVDKRFGESNSELSNEEKMLERFTKERERSSKKSKYSLESDDEYEDDGFDGGFQLTHSGKVLAEDEEDEEAPMTYVDEDSVQPERKKSKQEVMKEVIAKSKFYKAERQKLFRKTQGEIDDLDEDFQDVMGEINANAATQKAPAFSTKTPEEIEYDTKVRELVYDRRSVPADRTKTEEEVVNEYEERMKKLEADRLKRMEGERDAQGDDMEDDFWGESEDEKEEEAQDSADEASEDGDVNGGRTLKRPAAVQMPETLEEFEASAASRDTIEYINSIIKHYKPHLAEGNKDKMNTFVGILFEYIINYDDDVKEFNELTKILKKLSELYNERLVEVSRRKMSDIEQRIDQKSIVKSDLVYLTLSGMLFSTSDKYHLIIIPNLILMNKLLIVFINQDIRQNKDIRLIVQSAFVVDLLLQYQRISKRFDPEIVNSVNKLLQILLESPEMKAQPQQVDEDQISLGEAFDQNGENHIKVRVLNKLIGAIDRMNSLWKDYTVLMEINDANLRFVNIMLSNGIGNSHKTGQLKDKILRVHTNGLKERKPLALQSHRKLAIKTFQPKYEENFNPDKKSYDLDLDRNEINKMKSQLKKEKKATVKDIRRQNKFEANEKIKEKVKMYADYHGKMAKIVNSISTVEGRERNEYEREKRRANQK